MHVWTSTQKLLVSEQQKFLGGLSVQILAWLLLTGTTVGIARKLGVEADKGDLKEFYDQCTAQTSGGKIIDLAYLHYDCVSENVEL